MKTIKSFLIILLFSIFTTSAQLILPVKDIYKTVDKPQDIISKKQLDRCFEKIQEFGIPFGYAQGGCESRAYVMHLLLDSLKVPNFRIWIFAPSKFIVGNTDLIYIKNKNDTTQTIKWGYHTAPLVYCTINGIVKKYVLDPSIDNNEPIEYSLWLKKIGGYQNAAYTIINSDYFMFFTTPKDNSYDIDFFKYEGLSKGLAYADMKLEKNLALDYAGRHVYYKYIKHGDTTKNKILLPIIIHINNFEKFIINNEFPDGSNDCQCLREIFNLYPDFIIDSRNYFNRALKYWYCKVKDYSKPEDKLVSN